MYSVSDPSLQGLGIYVDERAQREPEVVGDFRETVFSRHNRADAHMASQ